MRIPRLGVLAAVFSIGLLLLPGCYGRFNITRHVHDWNGSLGGGWASEGLFILILPVYAFAIVSDAMLFNLFEFWTGVNPIIPVEGEETTRRFRDGKQEVTVTRVLDPGVTGGAALQIEIRDASGESRTIRIHATSAGGAELRADSGELVGSVRPNADGTVSRLDASGAETARFTPDEIASAFSPPARRAEVLP